MTTNHVDPAFGYHKLNEDGQQKARAIAENFTQLLQQLSALDATTGREGSIVRTKLEEACFFAKKSMAVQEKNQEK